MSNYFNEQGNIKHEYWYDLNIKLKECECEGTRCCHNDMNRKRYYDSIYDGFTGLTVCYPCHQNCDWGKINIDTYCIQHETEDEYGKIVCPWCLKNEYHDTDIFWSNIDLEDCVASSLLYCNICGDEDKNNLYWLDNIDNYVLCINCLQNHKQDVVKRIGNIMVAQEYLKKDEKKLTDNLKELSTNKLNREEFTKLMEKNKDTEIYKYLDFFRKECGYKLFSIENIANNIQSTKKDIEMLEKYIEKEKRSI